jgi:hypothetical protein
MKIKYLLIGLLISFTAKAQLPGMKGLPRNLPGGNVIRNIGSQGGGDSLKRRDKNEDSITIYYRYLDSSRNYKIDSSINDFTKRFPIPASHIYLGNTGNATKSILFSPQFKPGWDPGFHSFDVYKWKLEQVPFYNTTRPYSELSYLLGSKTEQIIEVFHTQNIKPNWNALFHYRMINAPGFFKNQKTNHNNYLLSSWFQSNNKRYNNYFIILANQMQSGENGGIKDDQDYLNDPFFKDRFNIFTKIGGDPRFGLDFFQSKISTGNRHRELNVLLRQQFDLGRKDSLVTDSTVIPLFYPRLRFEHTIQISKYRYQFFDFVADTAYYKNFYDTTLNPGDSFQLQEGWNEMVNDFSIYQFPDAKNLQQFIKVGASMQNLKAEFSDLNKSFYNLILHAEYRNRSRNQKWDIQANGKFYINGLNTGNYHAYISLQRFAGKKLGYLQVGFENVNRSPSFLFDSRSSFYLDVTKDFNTENTTHFFGSYYNPFLKLRLSGHYFLISGYTYFTDYFKPQQESGLFTVLQTSLEKVFRINKKVNWYTDIYVQQKTGAVQLNMPLVFTRNRLAFEGNFYKNLFLSMGFEFRYHTPYKADNYSPVLGQFFFQDSIRINNLPDLSAFLHFRIRSFKAFARAENLNTLENKDGIRFTNNNLAAPGYPYPGLIIRVGIYWVFIN